MQEKLKVAFIIPFAYENFFHFAKDLRNDSEEFEKEIISKWDTWHINWAKALQANNIDVIIYYISKSGNIQNTFQHKSGLLMKSFPASFKNVYSKNHISFQLLRCLGKDKPDIIFSVAHIFRPILDMYDILTIYSKFNSIPIVTRNAHADTYSFIYPKVGVKSVPRNYLYKSIRWLYQPVKNTQFTLKFIIKKLTLKISDLILIQTEQDYQNLITRFKIDRHKIKNFPKPINLECFKVISKEEAAINVGLSSEYEYLLHVSNLFNSKGCEHIIQIIPDLKLTYPSIKLIVVGDGPMRNDLHKLAVKLSVQDDVIFVGQVNHTNLVYYYNLASIFVLPTEIQAEGQPNVIMESIACNTFPIASNLPGPSSIIKDGLGALISPKDHKQLYETIVKVLKGELLIDQSKRKDFLKSYSITNVSKELKTVLLSLIK